MVTQQSNRAVIEGKRGHWKARILWVTDPSGDYLPLQVIFVICEVLEITGDFQYALDVLGQKRKLFPNLIDVNSIRLVLLQARMFWLNNESAKALEAYSITLDKAREMKLVEYEAEALQGMGKVYTTLGRTGEALECLERSLSMMCDLGL